MATKQEITLKRTLEKRLSKKKLSEITELIGQELVNVMRERSSQGYDNQDKRFKRYTPEYERFKKRFVAGKVGKSKTMKRLLRKSKRPFKARELRDTMQLTGELFTDMKFKTRPPKGGFFSRTVTFSIELFIDSRSEKKAEGLQKNGYNFFGFRSFGKKTQTRLRNIIAKIAQ